MHDCVAFSSYSLIFYSAIIIVVVFSRIGYKTMACLQFEILIFIALTLEHHVVFTYLAGSLIWSRDREQFIPIENLSTFKTEQENLLRKNRQIETHNFQAEILKIGYYQEENIVNFHDNDTKLGGVCGELWNMLSEYLNFTVKTIHVRDYYYGVPHKSGEYDGLVGMLQRNEIDIIPRTGYYVAESRVMAYTIPVWNNRYRLFIRPEWTTDSTWMLHMFSRQVWCSILLLFVFLSVLGYTLQKISIRVSGDKKVHHTLDDHLFYTFATFCCQGDIPDSLYHRTKILGLSKKILAWLILMTLSCHLISYMTNQKVEPPFKNMETMFNSTSYNIVVFNGSMVRQKFEKKLRQIKIDYKNRVQYVQTPHRLYEKGCWGKKKYAILESEDRQRAYGRLKCELIPTGESYFPTWVGAGLSKNFKYKRAIDMGILKLHEFGLTDGLKDRWMASSIVNSDPNAVTSVNFEQVLVLFTVLCIGMIASIVIFTLEIVVFLYHYNRQKIRRRNFFYSRVKRRV